MAGLHVAMYDPEAIIDRLHDRDNCICSATCRRKDPLLGSNQLVINPGYYVGNVPFARRGQNYLGDPWRLQMTAKSVPVTPLAGIVDKNGVVDAVLFIIYRLRCIGIDDADHVAIGDYGVFFFINSNYSVKMAVNRVTTQQACPLDQIVSGPLAHNGCLQSQFFTAAGLFNQESSKKTTDPAKTVEHDILWLGK